MSEMFYDAQADLSRLESKRVAIIGYGSQGHAHALNLHESGVDVVVGLYEGSKSWAIAEEAGLAVTTVEKATATSDVVMLLLPDEKQAQIYHKSVAPNLKSGSYLAFAHGFNIHFGQITPPADVNVIMIAPKGPGHTVRSQFVEGKGVPSLIAVHQDPSGDSKKIALAYAQGLGAGRAGIFRRASRRRRRPTSSVSRQSSVGDRLDRAIRYLVEAGYQPEMAYSSAHDEAHRRPDLPGGLLHALLDQRYCWSTATTSPEPHHHRRYQGEMRNPHRDPGWHFRPQLALENQVGRPLQRSASDREREPVEKTAPRALMSFFKR